MGKGAASSVWTADACCFFNFFFSPFFPWGSTETIEVIQPALFSWAELWKKRPTPCVLLVNSGQNAKSSEFGDRLECPRSESSFACVAGHCPPRPTRVNNYPWAHARGSARSGAARSPETQKRLFCVTFVPGGAATPSGVTAPLSPQLPEVLASCASSLPDFQLLQLPGRHVNKGQILKRA